MSPKRTEKKDQGEPTFEGALARLEAIVEELEQKDLSLEETLARYEEGSKLVAECTKRLDEAQQKIRKISGGARPLEETVPEDSETEDRSDDDSDGLPF